MFRGFLSPYSSVSSTGWLVGFRLIGLLGGLGVGGGLMRYMFPINSIADRFSVSIPSKNPFLADRLGCIVGVSTASLMGMEASQTERT